jgi:hypothetical protein
VDRLRELELLRARTIAGRLALERAVGTERRRRGASRRSWTSEDDALLAKQAAQDHEGDRATASEVPVGTAKSRR